MKPTFIHLHIHSEYSIVDGIVRIKPLVKATAEAGMPAVALTDQSNLFATVKFYKAAIAQGLKPILGSEIWLENTTEPNKPFKLVLLCQNQEGYLNLTKLVSKAYMEGQSLGKAIVKREWMLTHHTGLIALSGGIAGDVGQAIINDQDALAETLLLEWQRLFEDRFYIELHRTGQADEERYIQAAVKLASKHTMPVVATNDVKFIHRDDFDAHEARVCINQGYVLADPKRPKNYTENQYLRTPEEMQALFSDLPSALENTIEIAKRCNQRLKLDEYFLPNFPIPEGLERDEFFAKESQAGLENRLAVLFDKKADDFLEKRKPYDERLALELGVINSMGYAGYFLIVADFIRWAKNNDVPVGPGRGSGAGSLVAYALDITDLDPLEYDLLFERFLNPERVSMPDFDIDFCMDGRDRVIEYVGERYGKESVSQIITFGTMAAKAVIRDVGRVLNHPYGFVDKIAKLIPFEIGMTLDKALAQEEALLERYNKEEEVRDLIDLARKLEGITRNAGRHAGGVVIAPTALTDFTPLYCEENSDQAVTQFDKDDVESAGLVKFDFLGLRTLTIIHWAMQDVNKKREKNNESPLDITLIPVDDKLSFDLLKACSTTAVFQLESRGMKDLIKRLQPDCFEDIVALVALFRPGPLQSGMVDDFIDRKHGRAAVEYPHPDLAPILKPTYGVILYQEQVMQIAQVLAGYSLGGADLLRRAMGKKKPEEMAKQRKIFTEGSVERGVDHDTATGIFDLMEKFAGYGFNKSHSAAYALVAYQTAWIKAHYPAEFMAAVLSSDMDNTAKVVVLVDECAAMKLELLPPDVNQGFYKFTVNETDEIIYGLGAIKGVGESVITDLVAEREAKGPYLDLFDFCQRLNNKKANRRVVEALIKSGAFDQFDINRSTLSASLARAFKSSDQVHQDQTTGQGDLFGGAMGELVKPDYIETDPWTDEVRLRGEKETLGLYLTGHPIERYEPELKHITTGKITNLNPTRKGMVVIAGFIVAMRTITTKRGDRMAFVSLDDRSGRIELAVFSEQLQEARELLTGDQLLIVDGEISIDEYSGGFRMACNKILSVEQAREVYARRLLVTLKEEQVDDALIEGMTTVMKPYQKGGCPVSLKYKKENAIVDLNLGLDWRVTPADPLLEQLRELLGEESVTMEYA